MTDKTFADRYPVHTELKAREGERTAIQGVIDWIAEQGYTLCKYDDSREEYFPVYIPPDKLIGQIMEIDPDALEREKRAMLDEVRAGNPTKENT